MPFDDNGFLGKEALEVSEQIRKRNKSVFELIHEINVFAEKMRREISMPKRDIQKLICACLYIRIIEGIQASIILAERGLDLDTSVVLRGVFEALAILKISSEEPEFAKKYLFSHDVERLKRIKKALKYSDDELYVDLKEKGRELNIELEELKEEIEKRLHENNVKSSEFEKKALAQKAGFANIYKTFYDITSDSAHTNIKVLERFLEREDDDVKYLKHGPCEDNFEAHLLTAGVFFLVAVATISKLFGIQKEQQILDYDQKLKKLNQEK